MGNSSAANAWCTKSGNNPANARGPGKEETVGEMMIRLGYATIVITMD